MHSFRGMRKSFVCKEVFVSLHTIQVVFGREKVNGQRFLFNNFRVTHSRNIVKTFNWSSGTIDLNTCSLFGCDREAHCLIQSMMQHDR